MSAAQLEAVREIVEIAKHYDGFAYKGNHLPIESNDDVFGSLMQAAVDQLLPEFLMAARLIRKIGCPKGQLKNWKSKKEPPKNAN